MIKKIERTFDLINNKGEAYPLSRYNSFSGFFGDVEGLGMDHDATYQKLGNVYDLLQDNINQGEISGVVYFQSKYPYQEYARFVEFCQETPLKLRYVNPVGEYYRDGVVSKIEKNEDGSPRQAKIVFTASSLWYRPIEVHRDYHQITVVSDSSKESPCELIFETTYAITALNWEQYLNGTRIMQGAISDISIAQGEKIVIRTDTMPYQLYQEPNTDLYSKSDFTKARFPYLYKGTNYFSFEPSPMGFEALGYITVKANLLYETV